MRKERRKYGRKRRREDRVKEGRKKGSRMEETVGERGRRERERQTDPNASQELSQ